ncbi:MAG: bifunctional phosphopantothenoylcysteine decarboxylase/phosphopantothenate--cysteine ligase CoaBC [Fusobacteriaceae bacterium]
MKNILVGVTGGIAAYKSANIVSILKKKGYNVKVIMTKSAIEIITPLTLETLSRNKVYVDMWDKNRSHEVEHISLAKWADLVLIAPTTYNIVGKIANGIADDLLTTVVSATLAKVYFALAMNENMYFNPILGENVEKLKKYGYHFIDADSGFLACNQNAKGRLKKEEDIVEEIDNYFFKKKYSGILKGKKIIITAGRTEEPIDPIRYISNLSSGQMGYSLARAAANMGGEVILISGPSNLPVPTELKEFVQVRTAVQMELAAMSRFDEVDIAIACAAVGDYRPKNYSTQKIKKSDEEFNIVLERNPDILYNMGQKKKNQILIGFAAETENILSNAEGKLIKKNLDAIVANDAKNMNKKNNTVTILTKEGKLIELEKEEKQNLAYSILCNIFGEK